IADSVSVSLFFFQAEDGIRDWSVTGVQTCALPIWVHWEERAADRISPHRASRRPCPCRPTDKLSRRRALSSSCPLTWPTLRRTRSEERRVGKEWRGRWWGDDEKKKEMDIGVLEGEW